jgi:hypothetical protein
MSSSQFYGAGELLIKRGKLLPNCSWTHGVILGPISPALIVTREDTAFSYHFVTDEHQGEIASRMFSKVEIVGLPFAHAHSKYYDDKLVRNIKRLFLSAHMITGIKNDTLNDLIMRAKKRDCDALILPGNFFETLFGKSKNETYFDQIRILKGATAIDKSSYERIISIFSRVKTLVTETNGSHLFYASLCNCELDFNHRKNIGLTSKQLKVALAGLIEPWRSALEENIRNNATDEVKDFIALRPPEQYEHSLERVGMKFVKNLSKMRNVINDISSISLALKNANLGRYKLETRLIKRYRNLS